MQTIPCRPVQSHQNATPRGPFENGIRRGGLKTHCQVNNMFYDTIYQIHRTASHHESVNAFKRNRSKASKMFNHITWSFHTEIFEMVHVCCQSVHPLTRHHSAQLFKLTGVSTSWHKLVLCLTVPGMLLEIGQEKNEKGMTLHPTTFPSRGNPEGLNANAKYIK